MKIFLMSAILFINLLSLTAKAQTVTRADLKKTVAHMQQLAHELQGDLDAATAAKLALSAQLGKVEEALIDSQERADALQVQIDEQAREQAERLNAAILATTKAEAQRDKVKGDLAHVLGKYHFLKFLGAGLAAGLVFLLIWKWSPPLVGPWQLAVYAGPPVAAFLGFLAVF